MRIELEEGLAELPKFDAKPPNELVLGETVLEWLKKRLRTFLRNRKECAPHLCRRRLFASRSLRSCVVSMLAVAAVFGLGLLCLMSPDRSAREWLSICLV